MASDPGTTEDKAIVGERGSVAVSMPSEKEGSLKHPSKHPLRKRAHVAPDPGFEINILEPYKGMRIIR